MKRITYQLMTEVNHGTEEHPNMVQTFTSAVIECGEAVFEANFSIAQKEAYNGEVTVEDIEDPETEPTTEERVTELENTIVSLEDAICEMDEANEERMAAIEDALCEMDMG
jgi:hypothetical protein